MRCRSGCPGSALRWRTQEGYGLRRHHTFSCARLLSDPFHKLFLNDTLAFSSDSTRASAFPVLAAPAPAARHVKRALPPARLLVLCRGVGRPAAAAAATTDAFSSRPAANPRGPANARWAHPRWRCATDFQPMSSLFVMGHRQAWPPPPNLVCCKVPRVPHAPFAAGHLGSVEWRQWGADVLLQQWMRWVQVFIFHLYRLAGQGCCRRPSPSPVSVHHRTIPLCSSSRSSSSRSSSSSSSSSRSAAAGSSARSTARRLQLRCGGGGRSARSLLAAMA